MRNRGGLYAGDYNSSAMGGRRRHSARRRLVSHRPHGSLVSLLWGGSSSKVPSGCFFLCPLPNNFLCPLPNNRNCGTSTNVPRCGRGSPRGRTERRSSRRVPQLRGDCRFSRLRSNFSGQEHSTRGRLEIRRLRTIQITALPVVLP
jgi:hypothetical protein